MKAYCAYPKHFVFFPSEMAASGLDIPCVNRNLARVKTDGPFLGGNRSGVSSPCGRVLDKLSP